MGRGQLFTLDLIAACFIFLLIFGVIMLTWNSLIIDSSAYAERKNMELGANSISNILVMTPGHPRDWFIRPVNEVSTVGLSRTGRELDKDRVEALMAMEYDNFTDIMRLGNYYAHINLTGSGLSMGIEPDNGSIIVVSDRVVMYNGSPDLLRLTLWRYV